MKTLHSNHWMALLKVLVAALAGALGALGADAAGIIGLESNTREAHPGALLFSFWELEGVKGVRTMDHS